LSLRFFLPTYQRRATAPAFLLSLLAAASAGAQTGQASQQISITATRVPTPVNQLVADVTVIDRATIERNEGRTLAELLSQQAGLQFASNGGLGKTASLFIRGLESRHTLLLVDGIRVGSATVGTPSLDNLPLEAVERIEIVRGPMSSLYGNGAFGGVVQVFTRQATNGFSANAKLSAGSNEYGQVAGGVGFGNGVVDVAVQAQHTDTRGVSATNSNAPFGNYNPDRDGFRQNGGSLRLGWRPGADWRVELLALQSTGLTRIDDGPGADARAELDNRLLGLSARGKVMGTWNTRISLTESVDAYDTLATASAFTDLGVIRTRSHQASWENTVATPLGTALVLLERTEEKVGRPAAPFAVSERSIDALALGLNGSAAAHNWQASLRHDRNSQFGGVSTGALAYGYALTPAWLLGASYGTSQVLPSFNQLYFPNFGTPNLLPEEGKHGELSVRYSAGEHRVRAAWYDYRYRGFISSGPQPVNLPRVEIDGVTLSYEGRWRELDLTASYDHVDPRNATVGNANYGKQLARRARQALRLGVDWQLGAWTAGAALQAYSHRYDNANNSTRLGGYGTLAVRAEWSISQAAKLGVRINNVGDKRHSTVLGYDQPRREGFVTLRYVLR
jgi:vitamin B12 transporter